MIRFAAPSAGRWTMKVVAKDVSEVRESQPLTFEVAASNDNGFVRRSPDNARYFQFDSGKPYFVIGLNMAWAGERGLEAYATWFKELAANGGNFARVWMSHPNLMTETVDAGLGRYDPEACAFYDTVFELARKNGIYCMVTFNNYRDLRATDEWGPATWPRFPYNVVNGGPAKRPADFFTNEECRRLYRHRLRYIVARWGAYTSVAMWELWNEQAFTQVDVPVAWTSEMTLYLDELDPYDHLISTSFGESRGAEQVAVWTMPQVGWTQSHLYPGDQCDDISVAVATSTFAYKRFDKPHLITEFGIGAFGSDAKYDVDGVGTNMHNGVWAAMMSGGAGTACVWWWDDYVHPRKLWREFAAPAAFSGRIEWTKRKFEPLAVPPAVREVGGGDETFSDIVITSALAWGRAHGEAIDVLPNGQPTRALPQYLYGPRKLPYKTPTELRVDLPRATTMVLSVAKVSDHATLRLSVDGTPKRDFFFSALPGAAGQKMTEFNAHHLYEAQFDQDYEVELPQGRHSVALEIVGGDWISLRSVTLNAAKSSKYADLQVLAIQDQASGETLAWLRHRASNWQNDRAKLAPRTISDARVTLPVSRDGEFVVEWWDTRAGKVLRTDRTTAQEGKLNLQVPPVHRDIALRAVTAATVAAPAAAAAPAP
jgi:hypothetical protein